MASDYKVFRKRNVYERKALRLVRGETNPVEYEGLPRREAYPAPESTNLGVYRRTHFMVLRQFARRNGLNILTLEAKYVTSSELVILRWLAEAQRETGLRTCHFRDIGLTTSLRHCASVLKAIGAHLPPKTLNIYTDLDDDFLLANKALYRAAYHENDYGSDRPTARVATYWRLGKT